MKGVLKSLWAGARRRWQHGRAWFRDGAPLWIWLVVAAFLFGLTYLLPASLLGVPIEFADRLRWAGVLFQFAGLAMVVVGLNLSRQVLDQSSMWKAIGAWLARARYMVIPPKTIGATVNLKGAELMTMSGEATVSVRKSNSIENRLEQRPSPFRRALRRFNSRSV
jgi:hypothetical protein